MNFAVMHHIIVAFLKKTFSFLFFLHSFSFPLSLSPSHCVQELFEIQVSVDDCCAKHLKTLHVDLMLHILSVTVYISIPNPPFNVPLVLV